MERIPFGVTLESLKGGTGTYGGELPGEYQITWLKGGIVHKDEVIATLETDKVALEIAAPVSGRIVSVFQGNSWSANGEMFATPYGMVLAPAFGEIEEIGTDAHTVAETKESVPIHTRLTPLAKKIAEAEGVDISRIEKGTGTGGRVCAKDVENAKSQTPPSSPHALPAARAYAEAHEMDLSNMEGTGPEGLILLSDVENALWKKHRKYLEPTAEMAEEGLRVLLGMDVTEPQPYVFVGPPGDMLGKYPHGAPESVKAVESSRETVAQEHEDETVAQNAPTTSPIRKTIARLLTRSWKEIPSAGDTVTIDVTVLLEFISRHNAFAAPFTNLELRLDYLIAWYARELLMRDEFHIINGYWDAEKEEAVVLPKINIGIAVDTERGLVVPVVHDVEHLSSIGAFAAEANGAIERARRGALGLHEIRDLTFTVNNTGVLGGENPSPIIPYTITADGTERPTAMILALARLRKERRRAFLPVVFRFDHRLFDGREAVAFVRELRERVESKKSPEEFTAELSVVPRSQD